MKKTGIESRGCRLRRLGVRAAMNAAWSLGGLCAAVVLGSCLAKIASKVATVQRARVIPESGAGGPSSITGRLLTPDGNPVPGHLMRARSVGDMNDDLLVDGRDIRLFIWGVLHRYAETTPNIASTVGRGWWFADCNQDGVLNTADTQPFVEMLLGTRPWGVTGE